MSAQICSKHFINAEGTRLHPDDLPVSLPRPSISSCNKRRRPPRYQSVSLGDESISTAITTVHSWHERPSTCAFPEVPEVVSLSPVLGRKAGGFLPKRRGKVGDTRKIRDFRGSVVRRMLVHRTSKLQPLHASTDKITFMHLNLTEPWPVAENETRAVETETT